jgi:hypothetical protein
MNESNDLSLLKNFASLDLTGISSAVIGSFDGILAIRDRIYLAKLKEFWRAPEENKIKIEEFVQKTKEQQDWQKVGENFLLVVDSFAAFEKCYYYGKAWVAWLEKEINTEELLEMTNMLQTVSSNILQKILYDYSTGWDPYCQGRIVSCGISDSKVMDYHYDLNDESIRIYHPQSLSKIGEKLVQILKKKS